MKSILLALVLVIGFAFGDDIDSEAYWQPRWREMAELGRGYVVWESNRSGRWRLWRRDLDGGGERQLTPDEANRDHYGTHISPDGTRIVYISYPPSRDAYNVLPGNETAHLRMIFADGSHDRQLVGSARAYFENRCAVWINDAELIYIDGEGYTCHLDVASGASRRLTAKRHPEYGWLLDPTMKWAVHGRPQFSPYDAERQTIAEQGNRGGCQPYFTQDGVWGFWTSGAGGPIKRIHLASGEVGDILLKHDPRLPRQRGYLYFPMVSPCQRMFAVGASPDQHDHHRSDYAVFVFRLDPKTLEIVGSPARYSFDRGTDRYPNVFLAADALGVHRGKAPLTVSLEPDRQNEWQWQFGDGATASAPHGRHTYTRSGTYRVEARHGDERLTGTVVVAEAAPPRLRLPVIVDQRAVRLHFNEPIAVDRLRVRLESGSQIQGWQLSEDKTELTLELATDLEQRDVCHLEGIVDLAQRPNPMPPQRLEIEPVPWPSNPTGLVLLWQAGDRPNLVTDSATGERLTSTLTARGRAVLNHRQAMLLRGGAFVADQASSHRLLKQAQATHQLTIEATITPELADQGGPARIVTFSTNHSTRNFTLGQEGGNLVLRLRTPQTGDNAVNPQLTLGPLAIGRPSHIIVTYKPGRLVCYRNGENVLDSDAIKGGFDNWAPHRFLAGDEDGGGRVWQGEIEGLAIYNRFMEAEEAGRNARHYLGLLEARSRIETTVVVAELVDQSDFPTLDSISPYREALVVYEYRLSEVESGNRHGLERGDNLRVVHWALLDGETMPARTFAKGQPQRLQLEPFADNPQLEGWAISDTLPDDVDAPLFYQPPAPK